MSKDDLKGYKAILRPPVKSFFNGKSAHCLFEVKKNIELNAGHKVH
jgi:hypothetical protein